MRDGSAGSAGSFGSFGTAGAGRTRSRLGVRRRGGALLAAALAAGLLLTGCGADGTSSDSGSAKKGPAHDARKGGPTGGSADESANGPAASVAPDGDQDGKRERDGGADYRSTFALDVDTASYGYARSTLAEGRLPDPGTVRPEEFVNSFRQGYERPEGNGFSVTVDGARTGDDGWRLMRVGLATAQAPSNGERPPAALTFVIDISGSMGEPGRLDLVKTGLADLTGQLRADDSIALVTFSDEARTVLPMTRLGTSGGAARDRVQDAIDTLEPTDSTNLDAGVRTGYATAVKGVRAGATNRVVLMSDALANTGETAADAILERVADARRAHGITLFGVGVGSDYGDALMERLADKGDGHTTYVSSRADAKKVFVQQLPANVELRARDAKAQVAFDKRAVSDFRLLGYDNRRVADDDFRDDRVDGGEIGPGHTVTALYAVKLREGAEGRVAKATVRWLDPESRAPRETSGTVSASALTRPLWSDATAPRLRLSAVAAYFAHRLGGASDKPYPSEPGLNELASRAEGLTATTEDNDVRALADAVRDAAELRRTE
ncbi:von Willebrand factor type A domain-containing protein [Streptomyces kunmingensis]|uniref:von Willebrand factor type A domain-containing protein n=2 Tax=Streptomyces kunmingensis TaxID=68225 RepID=A0ABU6CRP7_9ACTN|nr:von Willebrand factor type A domain-containing protein [Streptomyces kunmingensis]MEB3966616.1 von Willebrand factor type A domain-containing protein [Streptomyces kunmingensis]